MFTITLSLFNQMLILNKSLKNNPVHHKVIERNIVTSTIVFIGLPFFAGPRLAGLAIVSVLLFEREKYFHSTSPPCGNLVDGLPHGCHFE